MSPPTRFCTQCGAPTTSGATHCARCGTVLGSASERGAPAGAAAGRSRLPSLVIGLIACTGGGFLFLFCGGIIAAIAIPNFVEAQARSKAMSARTNLRALWAAEQSFANAHDGEFVEFYVEPSDTADPGFQRLGLQLGTIHHSYEGYYDGDVFVIVATGNIDGDAATDEWELTSDAPEPLHVYDDIAEASNYGGPSTYDAYEYGGSGRDGSSDGGEVVDDLGTKTIDPAVTQRSLTAHSNLVAIWEAQQGYKDRSKSWLSFDAAGPATWTALGIDSLPQDEHHSFSAKVVGGVLTLTATGNVDDDAFVDRWVLTSDTGYPVQVKNDSLDLDLSEFNAAMDRYGREEQEP